jgi:hypothetical protein
MMQKQLKTKMAAGMAKTFPARVGSAAGEVVTSMWNTDIRLD